MTTTIPGGERLRPSAVPCLALTLIAFGCLGDDDDSAVAPALDVEIAVSEQIGTTVTLSWSSGGGDDAVVHYGSGGELDQQIIDAEDGSVDHRVVLWGLLPSTEYSFVVETTLDGFDVASDGSFTTGAVPTALPDVTIEVFDEELAPDVMLLTSLITSPLAVVALDTEGRYRWWHFDDRAQTAIGRATIAPNGQAIVYNAFPPYGADPDTPIHEFVQVSFDGSLVVQTHTPESHHDFARLEDGALAYLAEHIQDVDGVDVIGDRIMELQTDGTTHQVWSTWDDIPYDPQEVPPGTDWTHCGALRYEASEQVYYVSSRNLSAIWKVERLTGDLLWTLGGPRTDFTVQGTGGLPDGQHNVEAVEGGLLVFDNGDPAALRSRAVEYSLDGSDATEEWSFAAEPAIYNFAMGDVHRFDSEVTAVTWSTAGQIDAVSPAGDVVWRLNTDLGAGLAYVTWLE